MVSVLGLDVCGECPRLDACGECPRVGRVW